MVVFLLRNMCGPCTTGTGKVCSLTRTKREKMSCTCLLPKALLSPRLQEERAFHTQIAWDSVRTLGFGPSFNLLCVSLTLDCTLVLSPKKCKLEAGREYFSGLWPCLVLVYALFSCSTAPGKLALTPACTMHTSPLQTTHVTTLEPSQRTTCMTSDYMYPPPPPTVV